MIVNNAWYSRLRDHSIIVEIDGKFFVFNIVPIRQLAKKDLNEYAGTFTQSCRGTMVEKELLHLYGIEKFGDEPLTESIRVRLAESEKNKLDQYAKEERKNISEVVREFIREKIKLK